jgi:cyanophycinase
MTEVLYEYGNASPMLAAMRERFESGAVIGGTSAGAAIMSDPMITGGESLQGVLGARRQG